jgi:biopolymer transport protein ExbD
MEKKKVYLLIGIGIVVLLIFIIVTTALTKQNNENDRHKQKNNQKENIEYNEKNQDNEQAVMQIDELPQKELNTYSQEYINDTKQFNQQEKSKLEEASKVSNLIKKMPYQGNHFSLDYSFDSFQFTLKLSKENYTEGKKELNEFLKNNGLQDSSALGEVTVKYN